jgi:hypothetical protein
MAYPFIHFSGSRGLVVSVKSFLKYEFILSVAYE